MRDARHHDRHNGESYRRLERLTGSKRRRARSAREKAAIVAETFAPGANVSEIARRHGLNRGLHGPLPTLRPWPRGQTRTARGRRGSLLLRRIGLSPTTPGRSPGALPVPPVPRLGFTVVGLSSFEYHLFHLRKEP